MARLALLWALALAMIVPASAEPMPSGCTPAVLTGHYVFAGRGYIEPVEPGVERVHYGQLTFDGVKIVKGKQTSSRGGKIAREALEGTYSLDADCSGTMTLQFAGRPDSVTHWDFYVTSDGKLGHMIRTDAGSMAIRTFNR